MNKLAQWLMSDERKDGYADYIQPISSVEELKRYIDTLWNDQDEINHTINFMALSSHLGCDQIVIEETFVRGLKNTPDSNLFKILCLQILKGGDKPLSYYLPTLGE
jgi:hypothetical protein